jgi:SAM-dependent methyltransferase
MPEARANVPQAKFDAYAQTYDQLHQQVLGSSGEDTRFFALYKRDCLKRLGCAGPVLDYGCGIGNLTVELGSVFDDVHATDPSAESLNVARERAPNARFFEPGESLPDAHYGTVILSAVLHHVPPNERDATLQRALVKLRPGGQLVVFEHNPINPVTRKVVRDCVFDDDAILLWPGELKRRLRSAGFEQVALDYIVFFPRFLARLRPLEPSLSWLCLGAQTMTVGRRPSA